MTTVLDEVLTAETEAEQLITKAEEEAASALQEARDKQKTTLAETENKLMEEEAAALATEQNRVAELAGKIDAETVSQVTAVEQRFSTKREALKTTIKQKFQ